LGNARKEKNLADSIWRETMLIASGVHMSVNGQELSDLSEQLLDPPDVVRDLAQAGRAIVALAHPKLGASTRRAVDTALQGLDLRDDGTAWRDRLTSLAAAVDQPWRDVALLFVAVDSPFIDAESLLSGAVHRRVDAVYDALETEYCAWEVQATFLEAVEMLRLAQNSHSMNLGLKATGLAGSFAGGWFGVGAGPAVKAQDWLSEQVAQRSPLVYELAELVTACNVLDQHDATRPHLDRVRSRCEEQMNAAAEALGAARSGRGQLSPGEAARRWNLWRNVVDVFEADSAGPDSRSVPQLVGQPLPTARHLVEVKGLSLLHVDAARPQGSERMPLIESGWRVVAQHPPAGQELPVTHPVCVAVAKFAEQVPEQKARAKARSFLRATVQELERGEAGKRSDSLFD
jgi:hypothetical protein